MNLDDRKGRPDFENHLINELNECRNENIKLKRDLEDARRAIQDCLQAKVV